MIARTALLFGGELPAILATIGIDDGHRDSVLEALQRARDERSVCPRAGIRDVQVISARFRLESGIWIVLNPVAKRRLLPVKRAVLAGCLVRIGSPLAIDEHVHTAHKVLEPERDSLTPVSPA